MIIHNHYPPFSFLFVKLRQGLQRVIVHAYAYMHARCSLHIIYLLKHVQGPGTSTSTNTVL